MVHGNDYYTYSLITCLVTNDAYHAYDLIGIYKIHHGAGRVSCFTEPATLWLAGTAMVEVAAVAFNGSSNTVVS